MKFILYIVYSNRKSCVYITYMALTLTVAELRILQAKLNIIYFDNIMVNSKLCSCYLKWSSVFLSQYIPLLQFIHLKNEYA